MEKQKNGMDKIADEKGVIRLIRQDKDINCIAIVISSWHYLNSLATINFLLKKRKVRKAIILACYHLQAGFIVDEHLWNAEVNSRIERKVFQFRFLPQWREIEDYLKEKKVKEKNFYILRAVEPSVEFATELWLKGLKRNFVHILLDEGLGFYLRTAKGWLNENKIINSKISISQKDIVKKMKRQLYIRVMLKKREQLIYNTFFKKKGKHLIVNHACIDYLHDVLEKSSCLYDYNDYSIYENKVVICTQPFHDLGQIKENADIEVIKQICGMAKEKNVGVIIKPHPRERDIEKYLKIGVNVDVNNLAPLEIIFAGLRNKPKAIIGITTTSLVTANVLWGINSFSIVKIIGEKNFNTEVKEDIENFPKLFSKYVRVLERISDIFYIS